MTGRSRPAEIVSGPAKPGRRHTVQIDGAPFGVWNDAPLTAYQPTRPVLDAAGNPTFVIIPAVDGAGNPMLNPDGTPRAFEVPVVVDDGPPVTPAVGVGVVGVGERRVEIIVEATRRRETVDGVARPWRTR